MYELLFNIGSGFCHQLPERSYFFDGIQMPLCARCSGIYFAFTITILVLYTFYQGNQRSRHAQGWARVLLIIYVALMALDGFSSYLGFRETSNLIRLLSGSGMGVALASFTYPLLNDTLLKNRVTDPVFKNSGVHIFLLIILPLFSSVMYLIFGNISGAFLLLLSVCAIFFTFTTVMSVLVALFPRFENTVSKPKDAIVPLAISFFAAVFFIGFIFLLQNILQTHLVP